MGDANRTLLMFSGGRDSTLAALRIAERGDPMLLATVSSTHLVGLGRVKQRLRELSAKLPDDTPWVHVRQPLDLATDTSFYARTCLPCHHAYVVVCGALARRFGATRIAFGYVSYQSDWPEQSSLAVESLARALRRHSLVLDLPVRDLGSKDEAVAELFRTGLDPASLEQKCLRQVTNVRLRQDTLTKQIALWEEAIDRSMTKLDGIEIEVLEQRSIGELR